MKTGNLIKYLSLSLLFTLMLAVVSGCGKQSQPNTIYQNADPSSSALAFYTYDGNVTKWKWLYDDNQEKELLGKLSQGRIIPVADYVPSEADLPYYGFVIGTRNDSAGAFNELSVLYCGNHVFLNDGTVYEIKTDIEKITTGYDWRTEDFRNGIHVPCQGFIAAGTTGWNTAFMNENNDLTPAENISMESISLDKEKKIITMTFKNDGTEDFFFGRYFNLDVLIDGKWYYVPSKDPMAFEDIGLILRAGEEQTHKYYITAYGDLPAGQYRLVNCGIIGEFEIE